MSKTDRQLNDDQREVFNKVVHNKENIFFTGCAGTGKSFLLKTIISELRHNLPSSKNISVTASTGRAAFSISGVTLHSFAGLGLAKETAEKLYEKIRFNKKIISRWKSTKVLIIDEISMITGTLFNKLEFVARKIRQNENPFGGIQLVLTGDLLQLPPVVESSIDELRIFESDAWKKCINVYSTLRTVVRQNDIQFIEALTCIRLGAINDRVTNFINIINEPKIYDDDLGVVNIYATKSKTEAYNNSQLMKINTEEVSYTAEDQFIDRTSSMSNLLNNCPAPYQLELKIGAQVMLVKNLTNELVNGTVGTVTGFVSLHTKGSTKEKVPTVRFNLVNGKVYTRILTRETWETILPGGVIQASRYQIPLILAWAVTIHKSQGQTIQRVKADLTGVFEYGQVYTALSRAVSIETLEVIGFDANKIKVDAKSLQFYVDHDLV